LDQVFGHRRREGGERHYGTLEYRRFRLLFLVTIALEYHGQLRRQNI